MPALDINGGDPCSLLNTNPTLWLDSSTAPDTAFPLIANQGAPVTYLSKLGTPSGTLLKTLNPSSPNSLIQFLSGGTISKMTDTDYTQFANVVLKKPAIESIVDSYFSPGKTYTFSTPEAPILKPKDFTDILNNLVSAGYLISSDELFSPAEFAPNAVSPPSGGESLVYLYRLAQSSTNNLTDMQQKRKALLEARNLQFFGAFLAEYCYYRTRYEWLLKQYFDIYSMQARSQYKAPNMGSSPYNLFASQGTGDNQYSLDSATTLTQADYLKGLAYHMACLNTRMTDMRRLLSEMSSYYGSVYLQIQKTINDSSSIGSNSDLSSKITALQVSAKDAQTYLTEREFREGVMEYNSEKNRYSNILLGLYAFLNIAAVAMVIHVSSQ